MHSSEEDIHLSSALGEILCWKINPGYRNRPRNPRKFAFPVEVIVGILCTTLWHGSMLDQEVAAVIDALVLWGVWVTMLFEENLIHKRTSTTAGHYPFIWYSVLRPA